MDTVPPEKDSYSFLDWAQAKTCPEFVDNLSP
jgi:hypothetical protein